ncbi:MAG: hypothetical protein ACOX52_03235 [Verrucomicrobiota bacterium]
MDRSNFTAELCPHRNNSVAVPGFSCPNPFPRPFDTDSDTDTDPDLELASALTFSEPVLLIQYGRPGPHAAKWRFPSPRTAQLRQDGHRDTQTGGPS